MKDAVYTEIARIGQALSSPKRLALLELLCQSPRSVEELAREAGLTLANASQHLQVLRRTHLVKARKIGRTVIYRIAHPQVCAFFRMLRTLAEQHLPEIERIVRQFLKDRSELEPVDRDTLLQRVRNGEAIVIDVRPSREYRTAHVAGAISVPLDELERRLAELPRDREIVAYCRGPYCIMAVEAVRILRAHGFRAFRLAYDVHDWQALGFPVITETD